MKSRRGFTLVELLVVIGIIALLISILLPTLRKAQQAAQAVTCTSNLHMLGVAMANYVPFNHGRVPNKSIMLASGTLFNSQFSWVGTTGTASGYSACGSDIRPMNPYLGITNANDPVSFCHCPGDLASRSSLGVSTYQYYGTSYAQNQASESSGYSDTSGYHYTMLQNPNDSMQTGIPITRIICPSRMVAMAEYGAYQDGWTFAAASTIVQQWHGDSRFGLLFVDGHAGRYQVPKSSNGTSLDWTFYWNQ